MTHYTSKAALALAMISMGLCPIPIKADGSKAPITGFMWKQYQVMMPPESVVNNAFKDSVEIAVQCGAISGNLEVLDFDNPGGDPSINLAHFNAWWKMLEEYGYLELRQKLVVSRTPSGGYHVIYRCKEGIGSSEKLARKAEFTVRPDGTKHDVLVETKAQDGYILCAPSKGYVWKQNDLESIPNVTMEEREFMIGAGRQFDEKIVAPIHRRSPSNTGSKWVKDSAFPWDLYNERVRPEKHLEDIGMTHVGSCGIRDAYRRDGKNRGFSATVTRDFPYLAWIFTTSTDLPNDTPLDAFELFTLIEHGGDKGAASNAVYEMFNIDRPKPVNRPVYGHGSSAPIPVLNDQAIREGFAFEDIEDFDYQPPTFGIFGRYLRSAQINLLDAPESIGKTKMVLKWAANMSNGWCDYYDVEIPQKKTLIFTVEDDGGDLHESFRECKGKEGYLKIYREVVDLRGDELKKLEATIRANDFGLVVFDPLLSYMHGVSDINSSKAVNEYLVPIRRVAMETGACIVNIRHFNKTVTEVPRNRRAGGSVQFNSCHRSQIVIDWHTERKGVRVCTHERASNRVKKVEEPFGWDINTSGLIEWIFDEDMLNEGRGK